MQACHVFDRSYAGELADEVTKLIKEGYVIQSITPLAAKDNKICSILVISEDLRVGKQIMEAAHDPK